MPLEREADSLAKALHPFLAFDFPFEELRARGLLEFVKYDRPLTDDPVVTGYEALFYLFRHDDRQTRLHGLGRIVALMDRDALRVWFDANCR